MTMFSSSIQPGLVSLFSSTGSEPLGLFATHQDEKLPSDSLICLLNDATSQPPPPAPRTLITPTGLEDDTASSPNYALDQTVLHIQSPTLRTTYIRCPPPSPAVLGRASASTGHLGLKHPWIHLQVRNMGREWSFEIGLIDRSGREGIVRCSTFQKQPKLKLESTPLLLFPLSFPPPSSRPLTSWSTISLNLPSLLPQFSSAALAQTDGDEDGSPTTPSRSTTGAHTQVPGGTYSHVSYVKVYATCRLRRIWLSEGGPQQRLPWEFQLYAADSAE